MFGVPGFSCTSVAVRKCSAEKQHREKGLISVYRSPRHNPSFQGSQGKKSGEPYITSTVKSRETWLHTHTTLHAISLISSLAYAPWPSKECICRSENSLLQWGWLLALIKCQVKSTPHMPTVYPGLENLTRWFSTVSSGQLKLTISGFSGDLFSHRWTRLWQSLWEGYGYLLLVTGTICFPLVTTTPTWAPLSPGHPTSRLPSGQLVSKVLTFLYHPSFVATKPMYLLYPIPHCMGKLGSYPWKGEKPWCGRSWDLVMISWKVLCQHLPWICFLCLCGVYMSLCVCMCAGVYACMYVYVCVWMWRSQVQPGVFLDHIPLYLFLR